MLQLNEQVLERENRMKIESTKTADLKPVTKWVGGKRQLLPFLHELKPKRFEKYFEPFIGGGAFLFSLAPEQALINDANESLIDMYQTVKDNPNELLTLLKYHEENNSKEYYLDLRAADRDGRLQNMSIIERSARLLYMLRVDFNGLYRVNSKGQFNVPYGSYKNPKIANTENIMAVSNYFNSYDIEFSNQDFADSLANTQKNDFVYLDPPYIPLSSTSDFTSYTVDGFTLDDQKRLRDKFFDLDRQGVFVMLSNSDTPLTRELYQEANIHEVLASRNINSNSTKRGKIGELIITNY